MNPELDKLSPQEKADYYQRGSEVVHRAYLRQRKASAERQIELGIREGDVKWT